ncbi:anhydro-N-acetylmuramic acid kinase [Oceanomicrobium pacificus]|uniref:Anhydro-N-acetylmuramic acid kinase n=1 Tax=Oceanomicrobium pacificus TaxID=2692916 RepID=A0A6B0U4L0_9RHOB|nr:anhydro-N-acetylmuramic acid kinase [Oceanomicrobium pacificus]MXU65871.1 anhydro-N-acetylmuramic acid kinase [Oceanomicrobium pacificus]
MGAGIGMQTVIGMMSGTSLDAVDVALLDTDGERIGGFGSHLTLDLDPDDRALIASGFGQWPDPQSNLLAEIEARVRARHLDALQAIGARSGQLVGFHGQTLSHDPDTGRTFQIGDGARLASDSGCRVAWDFRSADMDAGGQGAPLAPFFHHACARWAGCSAPVAFVNIGGVANVTWVDPAVEDPAAAQALLAFDTGPGNALLNDLMLARTGAAYDADGATAAAGQADAGAVARYLGLPYFLKNPPKSLDRNDFDMVSAWVDGASTADAAATLSAMTVAGIAAAEAHFPKPVEGWFICGGGRRNGHMMARLSAALAAPVGPVERLGLDGDMLEAQAFAYLAARTERGLPLSAPGTTGVDRPVTGGRLSLPDAVAAG